MVTGNTEATIDHLQDLLDTKDDEIKKLERENIALKIRINVTRVEMGMEKAFK